MNTIGETETSTTSHANDELLTIAEVATIVRVPEATLRYWHNEVVRWLDEQSNDPHQTIDP